MIDLLWTIICCALVFFMQAGFMCLESGLTRSKNNINVAIKNLADFSLSMLIFWAVGFGLMFGSTKGGLIGVSDFFPELSTTAPEYSAFFLFQALFSGTATTIVSGVVAERMRFWNYLLVSILMSVLVYTVFGHWAWNGLIHETGGWLGELGFVDFAGSTVVHSVGAWVGLATVLILGPRTGRFDENGEPRDIPGSNVPIAILGVFILWFGWFGFNGGSTKQVDGNVIAVLVNTTFGGVGGLLAALTIERVLGRKPQVVTVMNGALSGLVAITACCHAVSSVSSLVIGALGAISMFVVDRILIRYRIDDAVGGIAVHGGGGICGTLAVALFGDPTILNTGLNPWNQLLVQMLGILVAFIWSFFISYAILKFINIYFPIRVTEAEEEAGLNMVEHGATNELYNLITEMENQRVSGDFSKHVQVEPFTMVGQISLQYNRVLDRVVAESERAAEMSELAMNAKQEVERINSKLNQRVEQLDSINQLATGRELRMIELKREINNYARDIGEAPPYKLD